MFNTDNAKKTISIDAAKIAQSVADGYFDIIANDIDGGIIDDPDPDRGGMILAPEYRAQLVEFETDLTAAIFAAVERTIKQRVAGFDIELGTMSGIMDDGGERTDSDGECRVCAGNGGYCCSF